MAGGRGGNKQNQKPVTTARSRTRRGGGGGGEPQMEDAVSSHSSSSVTVPSKKGRKSTHAAGAEKSENPANRRARGTSNLDEFQYDNDEDSGNFTVCPEKRVLETNVLKCLDLIQYGAKRDRGLILKTIQDNYVKKSIQQLTCLDYADGRFTRRITALAWHSKYPYSLASASKFGDVMYIRGVPNEQVSGAESPLNFIPKAEIQGGGAGYSITAMKFHEHNEHQIFRSSIDCTVAKVDLERCSTTQFYDTGDYNRWFCSLDVNCGKNLVLACDNKGKGYTFNLDGRSLGQWRLHRNKIHHCEFSLKDPNLLATSSLDKTEGVKLWDVRFMKGGDRGGTDEGTVLDPLLTLEHNIGLNCAKFSPVDGSRLMTSDQHEEIRVYQGPLWKDYLSIKHHHKQFQHITPIKADWHPVNDYIVVGRYPKSTKGADPKTRLPRAIDFFDSYSGQLVDAIYPPLDEICSLNVFNPTGEYLATGMNSKLILWRPKLSLDSTSKETTQSKIALSESVRNALRGRRTREFSPAGDSEDEDDDTPKKKKARPAKAATKTTSTSRSKKKK